MYFRRRYGGTDVCGRLRPGLLYEGMQLCTYRRSLWTLLQKDSSLSAHPSALQSESPPSHLH